MFTGYEYKFISYELMFVISEYKFIDCECKKSKEVRNNI